MKTYFISIPFICIFSFFSLNVLSAQEIPVTAGYELVDSVVYRPAAAVDSTLVGVNVLDAVSQVNLEQSPMVEQSLNAHILANKERVLTGYRVRIFFDNRQTSRVESEETLKRFRDLHKDVPAYRTYTNPYFKVTVGDFRTKSEAMELLSRIRSEFPSAFVVKESIEYPVIDKDNAVVADTIKVLRPKPVIE
jgi:hypothetical protein